MCPVGVLEREPVAIGPESALKHPLWLALLLRDKTYYIFGESTTYGLGLDIGDKAIFVVATLEFLNYIFCIFFHIVIL